MKTILIVDDSATMLASVKGILVNGGFKVETASDGEQALLKLKGGFKPDLIVTDINMPKLDGIGLIREARKLLRFVPILTLTTESQQAKRDEARQCGASGWLVKPIGGAELISVISQLLPGA
jgi:two-component system, chemotaxis family, chemotaxis protein CheY